MLHMVQFNDDDEPQDFVHMDLRVDDPIERVIQWRQ